MKKVIFTISTIALLSSCSRTIECTDPDIVLSFISFPRNSLDTVIVRKFVQNSNFQNLVDTSKVTAMNANITLRGDTTDIYFSSNPERYPTSGFDYQIVIPTINRTVTITDINKKDKTEKCAAVQTSCFCRDEILSLKVDNQTGVFKTYRGYANVFIR